MKKFTSQDIKEFVSKPLFDEKVILNKDSSWPKISIVTPSYNQAEFLERTILSVLNQNYPNLEYIIIDGGSTDGSVGIIKKYEKYLSYWISEKDKGQAHAINKGLSHASGEIVAWLNSDDLHLPGAVEQAVSALVNNPEVGVVYANGVKINEYGYITKWSRYRQYTPLDLLCFNIIHQPTVFIRRSLLDLVGPLDLSYCLLLDHELWLRIVGKAPIKHVNAYWAAARDHPTAKNTTRFVDFGREADRLIEESQKRPDFKGFFERYSRDIQASAICFDAIYLLAGGVSALALKRFVQAACLSPRILRRHLLQIGLCLLSMIGLGRLRGPFTAIRRHL